MADGKVLIDTEINDKPVTDGLDKVDKKLKTTSKTAMSFKDGAVAVTGAVTAGIVALKKYFDVLGEMSEAYKAQKTAEVQLETAAKNNPYLDKNAVQSLKNYAGQLQEISTTGDEELLPFMALLAASGRTQAQIQTIMAAALDVSASGAMSLDSAVRNLNKSFSGTAGELGESMPQIKSLTTEQLKNGEAVKIVAEQYKGMAVQVAASTGKSEQLKNIIGDLKESFGNLILPAQNAWDDIFKSFVIKAKDAIDSFNSYWDEKSTERLGKTLYAQISDALDSKKIVEWSQMTEKQLQSVSAYASAEVDSINKKADDRIAKIKELAKAGQYSSAGAAEAIKKENEQAIKKQEAYVKILQLSQDELGIRRKTEEESKKQAASAATVTKWQEALKTALNTTDVTSGKNAINEYVKSTQTSLASALDAAQTTGGEIADVYTDYASKVDDAIKSLIMSGQYTSSDETIKNLQAYADQLKLLKWFYDDTNDAQTQYAQNTLNINQTLNDSFATFSKTVLSGFEDIGKALVEGTLDWTDFTNVVLKGTAAVIRGIGDQLTMYAISATVIAYLKTLAPELAIPIAAAGAALAYTLAGALTEITGYAEGGVVGGSSYTGDKLLIRANSGERVLTAQQNATYEKLAESGATGTASMNVQVINSASDQVTAKPIMTESGLKILVKQIVGDQMANGEYNSAYTRMQYGLKGTRYTS